jgi:two-component system chemotaxis response regulator CheY
MFKTNTKFLVVDDMATMRKVVRKILKEVGYEDAIEAEDGNKAWDKITSARNPVDVIVCDWNMPHCSGLELLKRVRAAQEYKHLAFILLTAESELSQVQEAVKSGVDNYLVKPFTSAQLQNKLNETYRRVEFKKRKTA